MLAPLLRRERKTALTPIRGGLQLDEPRAAPDGRQGRKEKIQSTRARATVARGLFRIRFASVDGRWRVLRMTGTGGERGGMISRASRTLTRRRTRQAKDDQGQNRQAFFQGVAHPLL